MYPSSTLYHSIILLYYNKTYDAYRLTHFSVWPHEFRGFDIFRTWIGVLQFYSLDSRWQWLIAYNSWGFATCCTGLGPHVFGVWVYFRICNFFFSVSNYLRFPFWCRSLFYIVSIRDLSGSKPRLDVGPNPDSTDPKLVNGIL